MSQIYFT